MKKRPVYPQLFKTIKIGGLKLKNRINMAPLYLGYAAPGGKPSELMHFHYEKMAGSGAALVVVGLLLEADPSAAAVLDGFDIVSIANNHAGDAGRGSITDTIEAVTKDNLTTGVNGQIRYRVAESNLARLQLCRVSPSCHSTIDNF